MGLFSLLPLGLNLRHKRALAANDRGLALFQQQKYPDALAEFEEAAWLLPRDAGIRCNLGITRSALGDQDAALREFDHAVRLNPDLPDAVFGRANVLLLRKEWRSAAADFTRGLRLDPDNADGYSGRGVARSHLGEHDRAAADLAEAVRLKPDVFDFRCHRADMLTVLGRLDEAFVDFAEALRLNPTHSGARVGRGRVWDRRGRPDLALADYHEAVRLDPTNALAFNNRGHVFIRMGRYAEAVADLETAIRLDPAIPHSFKNLAWLRATCPDPALRDGSEAVRLARQALAWGGETPAEWVAILAAAHAERGDFDAAVTAMTDALGRATDGERAKWEAMREGFERREAYREEPTLR